MRRRSGERSLGARICQWPASRPGRSACGCLRSPTAKGNYQVDAGRIGGHAARPTVRRPSPARGREEGRSARWARAARTCGSYRTGRFPRSRFLRPQAAAVELRRSGDDLPSRVADNLYWLGRHVERANGLVRHLRTVVVRMTSEVEPSNLPDLTVLVQMLANDSRPADRSCPAMRTNSCPALEAEILAALRYESRSGTLDETLRALYRTPRVRDRISADTWRIVNQLDLDLLAPGPPTRCAGSHCRVRSPAGRNADGPQPDFQSAFVAQRPYDRDITRGPGWRFVDMGRRLKHILTDPPTAPARRSCTAHKSRSRLLEAVLEIADGAMTYRYRYMTSLQVAHPSDLLLTDETNPQPRLSIGRAGRPRAATAGQGRQSTAEPRNANNDRHAGRTAARRRSRHSLGRAGRPSAGRWTTSWPTLRCNYGSFQTASPRPISPTPGPRGNWAT